MAETAKQREARERNLRRGTAPSPAELARREAAGAGDPPADPPGAGEAGERATFRAKAGQRAPAPRKAKARARPPRAPAADPPPPADRPPARKSGGGLISGLLEGIGFG